MRAVVGPLARGGDLLARRDHRGMPHHRDEIPLPARLHPQNAEAGLEAVEGYTLNKAGQELGGRYRLAVLSCARLVRHLSREPVLVRNDELNSPSPRILQHRAWLRALHQMLDQPLPRQPRGTGGWRGRRRTSR